MRKSKIIMSYLPLSLSMFHDKVENKTCCLLLPAGSSIFLHLFFTLKNNTGDIGTPVPHHQYFLFVLCVGIIAKNNTDRHTVY